MRVFLLRISCLTPVPFVIASNVFQEKIIEIRKQLKEVNIRLAQVGDVFINEEEKRP